LHRERRGTGAMSAPQRERIPAQVWHKWQQDRHATADTQPDTPRTALEKYECLKATRLETSKSGQRENDHFGEEGMKHPHARFVGLSWESLGPPSGLVKLLSAVCLTAGSPLRRRVSMPNSVVLLTSLSRLCVVSLTRREHVLESSGLLAQLESAEAAIALKVSDSSFRQTLSSSASGFGEIRASVGSA
jgi:hypothetical protein